MGRKWRGEKGGKKNKTKKFVHSCKSGSGLSETIMGLGSQGKVGVGGG